MASREVVPDGSDNPGELLRDYLSVPSTRFRQSLGMTPFQTPFQVAMGTIGAGEYVLIVTIAHLILNDGTVEGIRDVSEPMLAVR